MDSNEIIRQCIDKVQTELRKITCYEEKPRINSYCKYEYINGSFLQESNGDRGEVSRTIIAHSEAEFIERVLYDAIKAFAFSYEVAHRRKYEDNRRQVNEIIVRCYECLNADYKYTLMSNLKDNIHIYFDLLDEYVKVSDDYLKHHIISSTVKHRICFIAAKEYAQKSGGIYDVAFTFDWVRYHISKIVSEVKTLEKVYYLHEQQYKKLCILEKEDAGDKEKYRLGTWDYTTFEKAEDFLKHKTIEDENAIKCAIYMLIIRIHTKRNVVKDIDELIKVSRLYDITCYRKQLEELFVTDKYGIFWREDYSDYKEYARDSMGLRRNCNDD